MTSKITKNKFSWVQIILIIIILILIILGISALLNQREARKEARRSAAIAELLREGANPMTQDERESAVKFISESPKKELSVQEIQQIVKDSGGR